MLRRVLSAAITKGAANLREASLSHLGEEFKLLANEFRHSATTTTNKHSTIARRAFSESSNATSTTTSTATTNAAAAAGGGGQYSSSAGLAAVPAVMKALGFSGAVPFLIFSPPIANQLPLDSIDPSLKTKAATLQLGYGATIISFLGGVHWGLALTNVGGAFGAQMAKHRFLWSVTPCLMVWPTLIMPEGQAAGIQAGLLGIVYVVDRMWAAKGLLPPFYMSLRLPLTVLAASGLALTASSSSN